MGCFVSCCVLKHNKKKKKKTRKPSWLEQDSRSYVPLDSDLKQNLTSDTSQLKEEKPLVLKLKKKVRFNLNVKAYEPIPDDDEVDGEEETGLHYEEDVIASSYPASYRYQNCRYSDSEEDGDIDLDEDDDDFSSIQSDNIGSDNDVKNQDQTSVEQQATESISDAGRYVSSVLCPVENLSQWRAVKAKAAIVQPKLQKENLIPSSAAPHSDSKRRSDVAVDASLSNWLSSLEMSPLVKSSSSGQRLGL
ncbi:uncharacterized protein LOC121774827 isoform X3 [Salvia splendens]|uniref:uncharacterized protein LOC121774827 isoform X3 n=1 Tax=Salvia splendens TaxID=180675 RepID=UPI001C25CE06|nr:uncharacterized protein LOC121774827 isoform X3 [Salvia splendens]